MKKNYIWLLLSLFFSVLGIYQVSSFDSTMPATSIVSAFIPLIASITTLWRFLKGKDSISNVRK
ncbi:hypothetical protein [Peribacillus acanthi]|uniref:hypothetical protein n=1 Tax=Peribacillus acanthi TaxID=2171554 RepID=UPI000D3E28ED|nr:hypothetical protein [Peribacillus acanthi]